MPSERATDDDRWRMTLPDALVLGMVETIAARRGDRQPHYTAHSHELTMNGYRADVDAVLKYIEAQGYKIVAAGQEDPTFTPGQYKRSRGVSPPPPDEPRTPEQRLREMRDAND